MKDWRTTDSNDINNTSELSSNVHVLTPCFIHQSCNMTVYLILLDGVKPFTPSTFILVKPSAVLIQHKTWVFLSAVKVWWH